MSGGMTKRMSRPKTGRVFISHSSTDAALALQICRHIEKRGVRCAIAPRDVPPGELYPDWITSAIESASAFVVAISYKSHHSRDVKREVELAYNCNGLPIIPVRIDPIGKADIDPGMRYFISSAQMFDAIRPLREDALNQLARSVATKVVRKKSKNRGSKKPSPKPELSQDMAYFGSLWQKMDREGRKLAWLWESAIGGLFWPFYRGMNGLGLGLTALLALLIMLGGFSDTENGGALMLLIGWLGIAGYLGIAGATLLRRHWARNSSGGLVSGKTSGGAIFASFGSLAGALFLPQMLTNGQAASINKPVRAEPQIVEQATPSDPEPNTSNPIKRAPDRVTDRQIDAIKNREKEKRDREWMEALTAEIQRQKEEKVRQQQLANERLNQTNTATDGQPKRQRPATTFVE